VTAEEPAVRLRWSAADDERGHGLVGEGERVLVVEDELPLAQGIRENLEAEGYRVELAHQGKEALERIRGEAFDLVLLDVMLPEMDGFEVCETARKEGIAVPVLFLTARGDVEDRIRGLETGGDDYLPKPFHLKELLLRVAAILRRRTWYEQLPPTGRRIEFAGNAFDFRTLQGRSWDGAEQSLTQKEAMILKSLAERDGEVVSREEILDKVWGYDLFPSTRTIDNFIMRLRKRFERDPEHPRHFHTQRGVGYRFTREPEDPR
jgi:two-component system alkaline phosphatase synthesis response regulator PhoP